MQYSSPVKRVLPLRTLVNLDERIDQARNSLQRTTETDPSFERRLIMLMELVQKRERMLEGAVHPYSPPAA